MALVLIAVIHLSCSLAHSLRPEYRDTFRSLTTAVQKYLDRDGRMHDFTLPNSVPRVSVVAQVSISGGEVAHVPVPAPTMFLLAVSADGATLLVADEVGLDGIPWTALGVPVLGGSPRRLGEAAGQAAAWSPDGQRLLRRRHGPIHWQKATAPNLRSLSLCPILVYDPTWSPDGTVIRFRVGGALAAQGSLWQVSVDGTNPHPLLPGWHIPPDECCGRWTSDGKYFVFGQRAMSGHLPKREGGSEKATASPSS